MSFFEDKKQICLDLLFLTIVGLNYIIIFIYNVFTNAIFYEDNFYVLKKIPHLQSLLEFVLSKKKIFFHLFKQSTNNLQNFSFYIF